jgi:riboflavin kinase/FMN adenylyltransferase
VYIVERISRIVPYFGKIGLSIGNFEGFHRGHTRIIECLVKESRKRNLYSAIITFKQHPLRILAGREPERLWAPGDKLISFKNAGIDLLIYIEFSREFSSKLPLDFIIDLNQKLSPNLLCLGGNFRFGRDNSGDIQFLQSISQRFQYKLIAIDEVLLEGMPISSTRIRNAVKAGNMQNTASMLGRKYSVHLKKEKGKSQLKPFISNVALPKRGSFSGEIENLQTRKTSRELFLIEDNTLQSSCNENYIENQLYKFYFDPVTRL